MLLSYGSLLSEQRVKLLNLCHPHADELDQRRIYEQQLLYGADGVFGSTWFVMSEKWL